MSSLNLLPMFIIYHQVSTFVCANWFISIFCYIWKINRNFLFLYDLQVWKNYHWNKDISEESIGYHLKAETHEMNIFQQKATMTTSKIRHMKNSIHNWRAKATNTARQIKMKWTISKFVKWFDQTANPHKPSKQTVLKHQNKIKQFM